MDFNEFNLDALIDCNDFVRYESNMTRDAKEDFIKTVKAHTESETASERINRECEDLIYCVSHDAFKQGFCFAMKSVKFLLKI
ncbi:MAG: hypothetical protein NC395_11705 [Prevotella sp.]|nr:hypothetical protein [Prevotella sp.]